MTPEDYVSYPIALALKKAGFDEPCDHYYCAFDNETDVRFWSIHPAQSQNGLRIPKDTVVADAPTLAQAQKWLREKGIHISVNPYMGYDVDADGALYNEYPSWGFELMDVASAEFMNDAGGNHTSYESALSAGIAAALELIEKKGE